MFVVHKLYLSVWLHEHQGCPALVLCSAGFLFVNSDCGGMSQKGSRKIHVEDSGDPHVTGVAKSKEKNKSLLAESGTSSSSFFSYATKIGCGALQDKSQVVSVGPSVKKIRSNENLWQVGQEILHHETKAE